MVLAKQQGGKKRWGEVGASRRFGAFRLFYVLLLLLLLLLLALFLILSYSYSSSFKKAGDVLHLQTTVAMAIVSPLPLPTECSNFHQAVEIGTSDFDTLIQKAKPGDTGLSVDAMQIYVDRLPLPPNNNNTRTCWRKFNAAIVGRAEDVPENGLARAYFIHPSDIAGYDLPDWLRGCNSVGRPHPTGTNELQVRNLAHLMQNISVPVVSVESLLEKFGVCRMGTFKVDVEGLDGDLLVAYADWVEKKKKSDNDNDGGGGGGGCYADTVVGEFNELSKGRTGGDDVDVALSRVGYKKSSERDDFDWIWRYEKTAAG